MGLTITNLSGASALRHFGLAQNSYARSMSRLASGLRIQSAADDPAGLAISERMRAQIRGLHQSVRNAQDGISLLQTAEGHLASIQEMVHRLRELSIYAGNGTLSPSDREALQEEFNQLVEEIDSTVGRSQFNNIPLLDGESRKLTLQVGPNSGQTMTLLLPTVGAFELGLVNDEGNPLDITDPDNRDELLSIMDKALSTISGYRSKLGAQMNRLEHTINNLEVYAENLTAAESRIRDVDIAEEIMKLVNAQIRMEVAIAMVAQANVNRQMLLRLLMPNPV